MEFFEKYAKGEKELVCRKKLGEHYRIFIRSDRNDPSLFRLVFAYHFKYPVLSLGEAFPEYADNEVEYRGIFSLILGSVQCSADESTEKTIIAHNLSELGRWHQVSPVEFNLLKMFILDAENILRQWDAAKKHRIVVIKSILAFLDSAPRLGPIFQEQYNNLVFYLYELAGANPDCEDRTRLESIKATLSVCFDEQCQDWFDMYLARIGPGDLPIRDMEQLVAQCAEQLAELRFAGSGPSVETWRNETALYLEKTKSWLLSRYNLSKASMIAFGKRGWKNILFLWGFEAAAVPVVIALFFSKFFLSSCTQTPCAPLWLSRYVGATAISIAYALIVAGAAYLCLTLKKDRASPKRTGGQPPPHSFFSSSFSLENIRMFLPRLAAGIAVGYFFLLNDDAWGAILSLRYRFSVPAHHSMDFRASLIYVLKIVMPLIGVLIYIYIQTFPVSNRDHFFRYNSLKNFFCRFPANRCN